MATVIATRQPLYFLGAVSAALARVYWHYHWLGDTIAGVIVGSSASIGVLYVFQYASDASGEIVDESWRTINERHIVCMFCLFVLVMYLTHNSRNAPSAKMS